MDFQQLFASPDLFLLRIEGPSAFFVEMDRDAYYRSIFCDQRISPSNTREIRVNQDELVRHCAQTGGDTNPPSFIFHIAHCGSTLLARALDRRDANIVYREPFVLRQLGVYAANRFYGQKPSEKWRQLLQTASCLLGRRYNDEGTAIVKANVPVNFIIPELLAENPGSRAILLFFSLDDYLLAILRSAQHRQWIRHVMNELGPAVAAITGVDTDAQKTLTDPEAGACLWLAQIMIYHNVVERFGTVRTLDAERLFARPREVIGAAFDFFGETVAGETVDQIAGSRLFTRYSKNPAQPFDNVQRLARKAHLQAALAGDLAAARAWLDGRPEARHVRTPLANPLAG